MAYYRNYRRRWYGRRYGRRYWRRNWYRRSGGNLSYSQKQGTRRFSLMIPVEGELLLGYSAAHQSNVIGLTPFYNDTSKVGGGAASQQLVNSQMNIMDNPLFQMYVRLYDEMKLNGVVYKFRVTGVPNNAVAGSVYTSIDRHATARDLNIAKSYDEVVNGVEHQRFDYTSLDRAMFTRSFWSRDLMEKAQFMDSTCHATVDFPRAGVTSNVVEDWFNMGRGGFVPLLYLCVNSNGFTAAGQTMTVACTVNYYFTFRNPKFKTAVDRSVRSEAEPVATKAAGKEVESFGELVDGLSKYIRERPEPGDGEIDAIVERMEARKKAKLDALRLARKKARMEKIKKLREELEKDDDTLIDPEEEVLPDVDDDLLMDDDDDAPTQPIKELENKSSS